MNPEKSFTQVLAKTALLAGVILVILWFSVYLLGYQYYANGVLILAILACFGFISWKAFKERTQLPAFDFGKAFQFVLTSYVVASLIKSIFLFCLLNFWDPNLQEYLYQLQKSNLTHQVTADKIPPAYQKELFAQLEEQRFFSVTVLFREYIGELFLAAIISAGIAYFVQRKDNNPAPNAALFTNE